MVRLKSPWEIERMAASGRRLAEVVAQLRGAVVEGSCGDALDALAEELIRRHHGVPSFKGYRSGWRRAFPRAICVSINEQVVHGIPNARPFMQGDVVKVDIGLCYDRYHADAAFTVAVGACEEKTQRLLDATEKSLYMGVAMAIPGIRLGDIGHTIESHVRTCGFQVIREYMGHGIGRHLHEDPTVPNYGQPGQGILVEPGLCLAIEPMVTTGSGKTRTGSDGWTVSTMDGALAAHFEHTVAVTPQGPRILTAL